MLCVQPYNTIIFYTLRQNKFIFKYKNSTIALISAILLELSITQLSCSQYVLAQNSTHESQRLLGLKYEQLQQLLEKAIERIRSINGGGLPVRERIYAI